MPPGPPRTCRPGSAAALPAGLAVLAGVLAGCSGEESPVAAAGPAPTAEPAGVGVIVSEVGEPFTFRGFTVTRGWSIEPKSATSRVRATVRNVSDDTGYALFEMAFRAEGETVETMGCSSVEIEPEESGELVCPTVEATVPDRYSEILVRPIAG